MIYTIIVLKQDDMDRMTQNLNLNYWEWPVSKLNFDFLVMFVWLKIFNMLIWSFIL